MFKKDTYLVPHGTWLCALVSFGPSFTGISGPKRNSCSFLDIFCWYSKNIAFSEPHSSPNRPQNSDQNSMHFFRAINIDYVIIKILSFSVVINYFSLFILTDDHQPEQYKFNRSCKIALNAWMLDLNKVQKTNRKSFQCHIFWMFILHLSWRFDTVHHIWTVDKGKVSATTDC